MTHTGGSSACILFDTTGTIQQVTISNCTRGTITYAADSGDIVIYSLTGGSLVRLSLVNLHNWRTVCRATPEQVSVDHCRLLLESANYRGLGASEFFHATNSLFLDSGSNGINAISSVSATGFYRFTNCYFQGLVVGLYAPSTTLHFYFGDCYFYGTRFYVDGNADFFVDGCHIVEWPTNGFLHANYSSGKTLHIRVRNCELTHSGDVTPFKLYNYEPTSFIVQSCVFSSGISGFSSMTFGAPSLSIVAQQP
jgi:hypothetical protein